MNTSRAFWILFGVLTAVAVHLAYILFIPASQLEDRIMAVRDEAGANKLLVAESGNAAASFAEFPKENMYAVCAFDLSGGPVQIKAQIPEHYWSVEIYGPRGGTVYTLNDQQAPRRQLTLVLYDDDPDPQAIVNAANSTSRALNSIAVLTGNTRGLAVIRSSGASFLERRRTQDAFAASSCGPFTE